MDLPSSDEDLSVETRNVTPQHLLVEIEGFSLLSKNGIRKYESRVFLSGGYNWRLLIYPDGTDDDKYVSAYLYLAETSSLPLHWEVNATFTIFLFNRILDNYTYFSENIRRFHAMNHKWGFPYLISKKSFTDPSNGYLDKDTCVFGAEVFVIKSQLVMDHVSVEQVTNPRRHSLVISRFSKRKKVLKSEVFIAGGYKWRIELHPKGRGSGKGRYVSIYLCCVDCKSFCENEKIRADVSICLKNKIHDKHRTRKLSEWFSSCASSWGFSDFISIRHMQDPRKGYVVDNCCILQIKISVTALST